MMDYQHRPIETWPVEPTPEYERRSRWTFKAGWNDTIDKLERELLHLDADRIVIQVDVESHEIRIDGMIRANAKPKSPRVILSFESKFGPLSYPCDSCEDWRHNIRSIALALEALRKVDLYGVTRRAEQYKGWTKLPSPSEEVDFTGPTAAKEFLADLLFDRKIDWNDTKDVFRDARTRSHPDSGGTTKQFNLVTKAIEWIEGTNA